MQEQGKQGKSTAQTSHKTFSMKTKQFLGVVVPSVPSSGVSLTSTSSMMQGLAMTGELERRVRQAGDQGPHSETNLMTILNDSLKIVIKVSYDNLLE